MPYRLLVAVLAWGCSPPAPDTPPPDIVFIVADTLRADHLELYGYAVSTAPNLSRLAAEGIVYERVVAPSSWTKTSMASIWTSRNALRHGVLEKTSVLPADLATLAGTLRVAGYWTAGVNSNPWLRREHGFDEGFDVYDTIRDPVGFPEAPEVVAQAMQTMLAAPAGRPAFLYVHFMDVHPPYRANAGTPAAAPLEIPGRGAVPNRELERDYRKRGLDAPGVQERVADLYDAGIRRVDTAMGDLLERFAGLDRGRETVVVFTSDHGEAFREHGTTEHGRNIYPEVYGVPLVIVGPGPWKPGTRVTGQVRSIDVAPTLLGLAGAPLPESFDGRPLPPTSRAGRAHRMAVSSVGFGGYSKGSHYVAVVSGRHLFIRERVADTVEFYDLETDPGALRELGAEQAEARPLAELERSLATRGAEQRALADDTVEALRSLGYLE